MPRPPRRSRRHLLTSSARNSILFFTGLGLTIYESLLRPADANQRPALIGLYALMMALPVASSADILREYFLREREDEEDDDS